MGSWKIICIFRVTSRSFSRLILPLILSPWYSTSPPEMGLMRMIARPMVVLPLPDSPTRPKVSPL